MKKIAVMIIIVMCLSISVNLFAKEVSFEQTLERVLKAYRKQIHYINEVKTAKNEKLKEKYKGYYISNLRAHERASTRVIDYVIKDFLAGENFEKFLGSMETLVQGDIIAFSNVIYSLKQKFQFSAFENKAMGLEDEAALFEGAVENLADYESIIEAFQSDPQNLVKYLQKVEKILAKEKEDRKKAKASTKEEYIPTETDLNLMSSKAIAAIPGISKATAEKIVKYRMENGLIKSFSDIEDTVGTRSLNTIKQYADLDDFKANPRKWTIMIFLNADNDLEAPGLLDVNEMEAIGSTKDINVVVQLDRGPHEVHPLLENGGWEDTKRFLVVKDNDQYNIRSTKIADMGEVDMADPKAFVDFSSWAMKNFPAERYMSIIWNHGDGWLTRAGSRLPSRGVSNDETSGGKQLEHYELTKAFEKIVALNNGKKIDIIDFDACLMGMIELAYQLKDVGHIMVASEEVVPGLGLPYTEILAKLAYNPEMGRKELSQVMVEEFTKSYQKGGSQHTGQETTLSAIDLGKITPLAEAVNTLAKLMMKKLNNKGKALEYFLARYRTQSYEMKEYIDLHHFCENILRSVKDKEIQMAAATVLKIFNYPKVEGGLTNSFIKPVKVASQKPGKLIWGINKWKMPPAEYMPKGSVAIDNKHIETPLMGPDEDGLFYLELKLNGVVQVNELNYRVKQDGGRTTSEKTIINSNYAFRSLEELDDTLSPLLAEGHSEGMANSHGLSIYYTPFENYLAGYKELQFCKEFAWDDLMVKKPKFKRKGKILLVCDTGHSYYNSVYKDFYIKAVKDAGFKTDVWLSDVYGQVTYSALQQYEKEGVVIWFTGDSKAKRYDWNYDQDISLNGQDREILKKYLDNGGSLLISGQAFEQGIAYSEFYQSYLRTNYTGDCKHLKIASTSRNKIAKNILVPIKGKGGADNTMNATVLSPKSHSGGKPFLYYVDENGTRTKDIAAVAVIEANTGSKIIYCGFNFEAITDLKVRGELMKKMLYWLQPNFNQLSLFE